MEKIYNKLKEKYEAKPNFFVRQRKEFVFPVYIFDLNSDIDSQSIVQLCKKYQTEEFKEPKTQAVYAWRSDYYTVAKKAMPGFEFLFDEVTKRISKIWDKPYNFLVEHFWFAIYQKGDSSNPHDHDPVDLACVYYASVPKNSAPLIIKSIDGDKTIVPKTGMLVIIPGYCTHQVPESKHEDGERIIVAMNVARDKFLGVPNMK